MARLIVQFPTAAKVRVDGRVSGDTNRIIRVAPGRHTIALESERTEPEELTLDVRADASDDEIVHASFEPAQSAVERFSPLYCRYNGFLLGQFLSLTFASYGKGKYPERRMRMLEFLHEVAVDVTLPEEPVELGSDVHVRLLQEVLAKSAEQNRELTDFILLGAMLTHYGFLSRSDPETARESLEQTQRIREQYGLPPIEPDRFVTKGDAAKVDDVLSPSLAYLREIVAQLEIEPETAFVIMPFKQPYASYFATLYRPSLEQCGYRAFRAWGGLSNEDYCDLLLQLIAKSGLVWADVSESNDNVLYEIGAAHAFGKLSMLVVREDLGDASPANIGHDALIRYSPAAEDWPDGTVRMLAALLSALKLAASRGQRLRIGPDGLQSALEYVGDVLRETLVPPEAYDAAKAGRQKYAAGDYAGAETCFDEAIALGLNDALTSLGRGTVRVLLGKLADAEGDLTRVLDTDEDTHDTSQTRMLAAYFRGLAREQLENHAGAREDYSAALELGYPEAEARPRRGFVNLELGRIDEARADLARLQELASDDAETHALEGDLSLAEKRPVDAARAYDAALAASPQAKFEFARALALLLAGRGSDARAAYARGLATADDDDVASARKDLERHAAAHPDLPAFRALLAPQRVR